MIWNFHFFVFIHIDGGSWKLRLRTILFCVIKVVFIVNFRCFLFLSFLGLLVNIFFSFNFFIDLIWLSFIILLLLILLMLLKLSLLLSIKILLRLIFLWIYISITISIILLRLITNIWWILHNLNNFIFHKLLISTIKRLNFFQLIFYNMFILLHIYWNLFLDLLRKLNFNIVQLNLSLLMSIVRRISSQ